MSLNPGKKRAPRGALAGYGKALIPERAPEWGVRDRRARALLVASIGLLVGLLPFLLYLRTLAPGVMYYARPDLLDAATLQVHAATLGVTHPTGYPTWVLLTHLFTYLPFGDAAYLTNLSSAVYSAAAVALVYSAGLFLTRRVAAAAVGALAFGLGATFWSQAVIAEVYNLNALFVALFFSVLLLWRHRVSQGRPADGYLLAASFVAGLALTNHLTSGVLIPAGLAFVALVFPARLRDRRLLSRGAGLFLLGLTPYLYLPIRASMQPPLREADPGGLTSFLTHVSGREVNGVLLGRSIGDLPERLALFAGSLQSHFGLLLGLAALGVLTLLVRDRPAAVLLGLPFVLWLAHVSVYDIPDLDLYFVPPYLAAALFVCAGAGTLLQIFEAQTEGGPRRVRLAAVTCASAAMLLVAFAGLGGTYAAVDRSGDHRGREIIETVAENAAPGATVLHNRSSLWYMVLIEERREDLTLLDPFIPERITTYDLVWPDNLGPDEAEHLYSTGDISGVEAAGRAAERGPVYIVAQESASAAAFRRAGFEIVPVEEGILYRLVPPGEETG